MSNINQKDADNCRPSSSKKKQSLHEMQPLISQGRDPAVSYILKKTLQAPIRAYQLVISPMLPPRCRFYPTCSHYAMEAIDLHGPAKGAWLAAKRVARCHPFHPGGYDPVPLPSEGRTVFGEGKEVR